MRTNYSTFKILEESVIGGKDATINRCFVFVACQQIRGKEIPKIMFPILNVSYPIHDWGLAEFEK